MQIQATNNFVYIIRDEVENEIGGLLIPDSGKEKPHKGKIFSVGELVQDKKIKTGKIGVFHKGAGFDIEYNGQEYLVIEGERIIGVE
jgi:co-chaperonin GroES (HSP10)